MIKILSTGKNYPHITFSTRIEDDSDNDFTCYIEQVGSGDYVANFETSITIRPIEEGSDFGDATFVNKTNYEMKLYDEMYEKTYTLAPRGGSKIISNATADSYYCIITYTSPNPPPETVDVQAIVMG